MTKPLIAIISITLLIFTCLSYQDASALEQKQTKIPYKTAFETKLQKPSIDATTQTNSKTTKQDNFTSEKDWFFSIFLPDGWKTQSSFPFSFASTQTDGNHVLVDYYTPDKTSFASRDDFHSYLKSTEYLASGFGLGNSIMTTDTDYGYMTVIELKYTKQDGNQMMLRKDFHFMSKEGKMYLLHGFSSDADSFSTLKKTLNTFKPLA